MLQCIFSLLSSINWFCCFESGEKKFEFYFNFDSSIYFSRAGRIRGYVFTYFWNFCNKYVLWNSFQSLFLTLFFFETRSRRFWLLFPSHMKDMSYLHCLIEANSRYIGYPWTLLIKNRDKLLTRDMKLYSGGFRAERPYMSFEIFLALSYAQNIDLLKFFSEKVVKDLILIIASEVLHTKRENNVIFFSSKSFFPFNISYVRHLQSLYVLCRNCWKYYWKSRSSHIFIVFSSYVSKTCLGSTRSVFRCVACASILWTITHRYFGLSKMWSRSGETVILIWSTTGTCHITSGVWCFEPVWELPKLVLRLGPYTSWQNFKFFKILDWLWNHSWNTNTFWCYSSQAATCVSWRSRSLKVIFSVFLFACGWYFFLVRDDFLSDCDRNFEKWGTLIFSVFLRTSTSCGWVKLLCNWEFVFSIF